MVFTSSDDCSYNISLFYIEGEIMTVQQKLVDFNNPVFKALLARSFKVTEGSLKHFVLPTVGDTITLGNVIYKISHVRENPYRFSAEPIGILSDDELEEAIRKAVS